MQATHATDPTVVVADGPGVVVPGGVVFTDVVAGGAGAVVVGCGVTVVTWTLAGGIVSAPTVVVVAADVGMTTVVGTLAGAVGGVTVGGTVTDGAGTVVVGAIEVVLTAVVDVDVSDSDREPVEQLPTARHVAANTPIRHTRTRANGPPKTRNGRPLPGDRSVVAEAAMLSLRVSARLTLRTCRP